MKSYKKEDKLAALSPLSVITTVMTAIIFKGLFLKRVELSLNNSSVFGCGSASHVRNTLLLKRHTH